MKFKDNDIVIYYKHNDIAPTFGFLEIGKISDEDKDKIIVSDKIYYWENEEWDSDNKEFKPNKEFNGNVKEFLSKKGIATGFLVTVDYHW